MAFSAYYVFFLLSHLLLYSLAQEEKRFNPRCPPFDCGYLGNIGFPFSNRTHPECGLLVVDNCTENVHKIRLGKDGQWFSIRGISQDNMVLLYDRPREEHAKYCSPKRSLKHLSLPLSPFLSLNVPYNQSLYDCPRNYKAPNISSFACTNPRHSYIYYSYPGKTLPPPSNCTVINFQVNRTQTSVEYSDLFMGEFILEVNVANECVDCFLAGGQCQTDNEGQFDCSVKERTGQEGEDKKLGLKLGLGLAVSATATGIFIVLVFCSWRKSSPHNAMLFCKMKTKNYQNIEAFLRNHGSHSPKRYSYSDIKKMTNSFRHKIGQGGYGGVYKGRLLDGRDVAVKNLIDSKGNGEEFINEVASISKTSHVNIVTLLGFCFEGRTRALIYEYMSNGSLEKFIHEKDQSQTNHSLKWETFYQIAIGIARGLEYLHRGCSTRILHFDIKPHNILLDEDFCPKISDFGLAKICPKKESIVSMTGARGTIGYIAPEVFSRHFGVVSHKSDVYSYGMMVIEMTGGRQNNNVGVDNSSEIYFPQWIYERLEVGEELGLQGISNEEDKECVRKMIIVSLWCIQTNPSDRPTMSRVVEMLEGSINSLQIPPKPFLSSSGSAPRDSSISLLS
ncbi:LEAF RUST 10 DISEASE-RESISTANCE LOCUS RECEPTOR-LIKE PROTEIN KINASE-like 2.1 [Pistacia vera]|uniref:LEAF RUST 10 DISEASE-RESISTANCE LOCUS RECEPTOR-LIKE PROTEIN KINASE-like 2.1 n=1 Tax=Pistacia vera TaxID=55513 RepID=UPI001262AE8D|nr:LEAF RUST 10 DISEASE-RESISTANCE LOCUS RECEPTOR-LIKE PROTEIN KINASE-like 2.1 [Pistacia vera]